MIVRKIDYPIMAYTETDIIFPSPFNAAPTANTSCTETSNNVPAPQSLQAATSIGEGEIKDSSGSASDSV